MFAGFVAVLLLAQGLSGRTHPSKEGRGIVCRDDAGICRDAVDGKQVPGVCEGAGIRLAQSGHYECLATVVNRVGKRSLCHPWTARKNRFWPRVGSLAVMIVVFDLLGVRGLTDHGGQAREDSDRHLLQGSPFPNPKSARSYLGT